MIVNDVQPGESCLLAGQIKIQLRNVRVQFGGRWCVKTETAGIELVSSRGVVRGIFRGCRSECIQGRLIDSSILEWARIRRAYSEKGLLHAAASRVSAILIIDSALAKVG